MYIIHVSSKNPGKTPTMSKFQERLVIFGFPVVDLGGVSRKTMENQNFNLTCCLHKESLIAGEFIPVHGPRDGTHLR